MAKADKNRQARQLSMEQQNAVDLLVVGKSDADVAAAVGVSRQTVNAWRNHDSEFLASLNRERAAVWQGSRDALRSLAGRAVEVLHDSLESEDGRERLAAAVHVLKSAAVYGAPPMIGDTDAADIENGWASEARMRALSASIGRY